MPCATPCAISASGSTRFPSPRRACAPPSSRPRRDPPPSSPNGHRRCHVFPGHSLCGRRPGCVVTKGFLSKVVNPTGLDVAFELAIPSGPVVFEEPGAKLRKLLGRERLDLLLDPLDLNHDLSTGSLRSASYQDRWKRPSCRLTGVGAKSRGAVSSYPVLPKCLRNSSSANRAPSSVSTTDFAFDFGSEMKPWACSRSSEFQSNPFHALVMPWSVYPLK